MRFVDKTNFYDLVKGSKAIGTLPAIIVIISLLLPSAAFGEKWDTTEIALYAVALTLDYVDYRQTIEIVRSDYYETNPMLGKYPSESRVRNHFILSAIGSYLIADNIKHRKAFLIGFILVEALFVNHNISIGIRF